MLRSVTWQVGWLLWVIDEICHTLFMNWCILFIDGLSEEKHWYTSLQSDSQSELLFCKKRNNERSGFVLFSSHRTDKNHTSFKKFFISVLWSKNFPNLVPSFSISRLFFKKKKKNSGENERNYYEGPRTWRGEGPRIYVCRHHVDSQSFFLNFLFKLRSLARVCDVIALFPVEVHHCLAIAFRSSHEKYFK